MPRLLRDHARPRRPVPRPARPSNEIVLQPPARRLPARRRRRCSTSASPARCCAPPATRGTCARRCRTRATRTSTSRSRSAPGRQLRPLRGARRRDEGVGEDHRAGARRPARGPAHHRRPQGRAAAAPRARHLDGGAHPPLQARDRGLPGTAGRGVLPDRGPPRRAGLLRALRRLEQARARAHARPELRQPPGHRADGARTPTSPTSSRRSRCSTRSSEGSTGNGDRPDTRAALRARLARFPAGTRPRDLDEGPGGVPDPATTPVPEELRDAIEAYMARYPDHRSAAIPALHAVQDMYGWCTPRGHGAGGVRDAPDARATSPRWRPSTTCSSPSRWAATTSSCARTSRARCAAPTSCTRPSTSAAATTRASTSAPSSASARATWRRWPRSTATTSGRSRIDEVPAVLDAVRAAARSRCPTASSSA